MTAATHIRTAVERGVGTLTIDRPERFNSLDVTTARDLRKAGLQLARDPAVRVVVLRGSPGIFCSGADLKYIRSGGNPAELAYLTPGARPVPLGPGEIFKQILEYLHATISEIRRAPKPFLAAVDGACAAGGLGLAMACDLVLASERSTFEWAYAKTGLSGAESSTFFVPRLVGLRFAAEMLLLNPRLDAAEAREVGLVNRVLPVSGFDPGVEAVARSIAAGPSAAYAAAKQLFNEAMGVDRLDHHLDRELEALVRSADSPEFAEGVDAFFAKRPPRFPGAE
ncbi:MAG TPA: enoyl-CoA hydratase-related protein [Myxococcaceae bacterium]|nr:enoyl-CoA hydratase-related protein [Myxococcaceae bacterium]